MQLPITGSPTLALGNSFPAVIKMESGVVGGEGVGFQTCELRLPTSVHDTDSVSSWAPFFLFLSFVSFEAVCFSPRAVVASLTSLHKPESSRTRWVESRAAGGSGAWRDFRFRPFVRKGWVERLPWSQERSPQGKGTQQRTAGKVGLWACVGTAVTGAPGGC